MVFAFAFVNPSIIQREKNRPARNAADRRHSRKYKIPSFKDLSIYCLQVFIRSVLLLFGLSDFIVRQKVTGTIQIKVELAN